VLVPMVLIAGAGAAFHFGLFSQFKSSSAWTNGYTSNFVGAAPATQMMQPQQLGAASL
jgi:hypothetical protein